MAAVQATTKECCGTDLACLAIEAEIVAPRIQVRHNPSFVTQLIATAADLPHTRQRRRAEPDVALAAYTSTPARNGRTCRIV